MNFFRDLDQVEGFGKSLVEFNRLERELKKTSDGLKIYALVEKMKQIRRRDWPLHLENSLVSEVFRNPQVDGKKFLYQTDPDEGFMVHRGRIVRIGQSEIEVSLRGTAVLGIRTGVLPKVYYRCVDIELFLKK